MRARLILIGMLAALGVVLVDHISWEALSVAEVKDRAADPDNPDLYLYMGAASCSGSACHGSTIPRNKLGIAQNEYYIWSEKDDHNKAYDVLTKPDAKLIAKNLKIAKPEESDRCLVCHAVQAGRDRQGSLFDVTEGVSCEACHGPAEKWLGPHIRKDWDRKKGEALGMYNTKDLAKRAGKCLECHAGVDGKIVDHELIGAGHPRLSFEIDNYSAVMPAHWQPPKEKQARDWLGTRSWAVGQAMGLRNEVKLLLSTRKSRAGVWPDFAHFDCNACHHPVVDRLRNITDSERNDQRWRFRDYDGKPGRLVWNASSYTVFRHIVHQVASDEAKNLDALVKTVHDGLTGKATPEALAAALVKLSEVSERLVKQIGQYPFTQQTAVALMRGISGDGRRLAGAGFQSAEQAVFALASLYDAYVDAVGPASESKAVRDGIDALYREIQSGRSFDPARFEAVMTNVQGSLAQLSAGAPASPAGGRKG